ncbi:MAG TPA: transcription termination/antitermination NusG family protein [Gemmatimonadaceae bacterium]|nr:transcription termination/antitermination NusG family protein [Gemmatimonadaceae bacterium]
MQLDLEWKLVYTKARCEAWCEANLRNQGFAVISPRVRSGDERLGPLFPRYVFIGHGEGRDIRSVRSTRGVHSVVQFGDRPLRVPQAVIDEVRARMDANGVVHLDAEALRVPLFDRRERERVRALVKLASAGFRVRAA